MKLSKWAVRNLGLEFRSEVRTSGHKRLAMYLAHLLLYITELLFLRTLEKEMTTHYSILAWKIPRTEKPSGLYSQGHKESDMTK